jgi:hypothetical protein
MKLSRLSNHLEFVAVLTFMTPTAQLADLVTCGHLLSRMTVFHKTVCDCAKEITGGEGDDRDTSSRWLTGWDLEPSVEGQWCT